MLISQKINDIMRDEDNVSVKIIENSYIELEDKEKRRIGELSRRLEELQKAISSDMENKIKSAVDLFDVIIQKEKPDRKMLELILNKIYIFHDKTIEFRLLVDIEKLIYQLE